MSKEVHNNHQCDIGVGDDHGGTNCAECTFDFLCHASKCSNLPPCAKMGRICTHTDVEKLNPEHRTFTIDGDPMCKYAQFSFDGDMICTPPKRL